MGIHEYVYEYIYEYVCEYVCVSGYPHSEQEGWKGWHIDLECGYWEFPPTIFWLPQYENQVNPKQLLLEF